MKNDSDSIRSGVKRDFPAAPIYGLPIELVGIGWADIETCSPLLKFSRWRWTQARKMISKTCLLLTQKGRGVGVSSRPQKGIFSKTCWPPFHWLKLVRTALHIIWCYKNIKELNYPIPYIVLKLCVMSWLSYAQEDDQTSAKKHFKNKKKLLG